MNASLFLPKYSGARIRSIFPLRRESFPVSTFLALNSYVTLLSILSSLFRDRSLTSYFAIRWQRDSMKTEYITFLSCCTKRLLFFLMLREFFLLSLFSLNSQLGFCMFVFYLPFMTYYRINEIKNHKQYNIEYICHKIFI